MPHKESRLPNGRHDDIKLRLSKFENNFTGLCPETKYVKLCLNLGFRVRLCVSKDTFVYIACSLRITLLLNLKVMLYALLLWEPGQFCWGLIVFFNFPWKLKLKCSQIIPTYIRLFLFFRNSEARLFLDCEFWSSCSYKTDLIKKRVYCMRTQWKKMLLWGVVRGVGVVPRCEALHVVVIVFLKLWIIYKWQFIAPFLSDQIGSVGSVLVL